tara:strand:+ start:50 stop:979 length:930 start_codon:yes stop_codon:yes gene_type:complete
MVRNYTFQDGKTTLGPYVKYLIYDPYPEGNPAPPPKLMGSIILPMPGGLEFSNQASYEESNDVVTMMTSAFGGAVNQAISAVEAGAAGKKGIGSLIGAITSVVTDVGVGKALLKEGVEVAKTLSPILGRPQARKRKINEYAEHMFEGVPFRSFTFTHTLVPDNQGDSIRIQSIIKRLQLALTPELSNKGSFFERPEIIKPQFFLGDGIGHPYIPNLEFSVIKNCTVNYAPQEPFHQHIDGAPTQTTISIEIEEMIPITQAQIKSPGSGEIIDANSGKDTIDRFMAAFEKEKIDETNSAAEATANAQAPS